mgnify:CR=1 FL=1
MYRSNKEFTDSQKVRVKELTIFLNDKKHCVINDDDAASKQIELLSRLHAGKVLRVEKGGKEND